MAYQQPTAAPQNISYPDDIEASGGGSNSGTYDTQEQELLRLLLDVSDLLKDFEHRVLRGQYEYVDVNTGEKKWKEFYPGRPVMNELGVREILSRVIGKVSKANKLSYKDEKQICQDMYYFHLSIVELAAKRSDLWECEEETVKAIIDAAIELVWDISASSLRGFSAVNIRSSYSRVDSTRTDSQVREPKSFLGLKLGK